MSGPRLRRARAGDAAALAACIDAAYGRYAGRIADLPPVSEGLAEEIAAHQVWVAIEADAVIGGLVLMAGDGFLKLANLAVHPAHGGRGLGRRLIALAEAEAARQGFAELRLSTHAAMPENVRLYARLGWEETGREGSRVSMRRRVERG